MYVGLSLCRSLKMAQFTRLHIKCSNSGGGEYACCASQFWFTYCWPALMTRYTMLANVRPSVIHLSVVRPVIISWKENKIDPQLLWNTIGTTDSVAALRSFPRRPWEIFWVQTQICSNINTTSCSTWRQTAAVVNRARPSSHRRCCQLLKTECDRHNLLLTIISTVATLQRLW